MGLNPYWEMTGRQEGRKGEKRGSFQHFTVVCSAVAIPLLPETLFYSGHMQGNQSLYLALCMSSECWSCLVFQARKVLNAHMKKSMQCKLLPKSQHIPPLRTVGSQVCIFNRLRTRSIIIDTLITFWYWKFQWDLETKAASVPWDDFGRMREMSAHPYTSRLAITKLWNRFQYCIESLPSLIIHAFE